MPKSSNQKAKLLYLRDFLLSQTDENHPATIKEMTAYLLSNGIKAERKSLYDDIEVLREYGMDIIQNKGNYYIGTRDFELPELKLLVDSIQSSKFITYKKTDQLIRKIEQLSSIYEGQLLNRQVFVANRIKSMNESIYYNIDEIHTGITSNRRIRFHYFEYNLKKERVLRKDGAFYIVSPYALTWDDENYYLVAFDDEADMIKHYRVDKMADISVMETPRGGQASFSDIDMGIYAKKVFGMFSGKEETVQLRVANHLVGAVIDRFGKDTIIVPDDAEHFTTQVSVVVSAQFFGWVCGFGGDMMITAPAAAAEQMRQRIQIIAAQYAADDRQ